MKSETDNPISMDEQIRIVRAILTVLNDPINRDLGPSTRHKISTTLITGAALALAAMYRLPPFWYICIASDTIDRILKMPDYSPKPDVANQDTVEPDCWLDGKPPQ